MKVLVPENCTVWTNQGICFPKDLDYGIEIFTIGSDNKLIPHLITHDLEEAEPMEVKTIITNNTTCTVIPNYKIQQDGKTVPMGQLSTGKNVSLVNLETIQEFKEFHDMRSMKFLESTPLSSLGAFYLGLSGLKEGKEATYFEKPDEKSMYDFAKNVQNTLVPEFGGDVSVTTSRVNTRFTRKKVSFLVLYRSKKFYELRRFVNLADDKMPNLIYMNGLNIYFGFLRALLTEGFLYYFDSHVRGAGNGRHVVISIPWKNKIRKLLQNSCILWNVYTLSIEANKQQKNIDEVKIQKSQKYEPKQPILEVKTHMVNCYELEIPLGSKLIMDSLVIKPFELDEEELQDLKSFKDRPEFHLQELREKLHREGLPIFQTISQIKKSDNPYGLHVIGIVKNKGDAVATTTRYGKTLSMNAILCDETEEITMRIWGDITLKISEGDILELTRAWTKQGILHNSSKGYEKIH